MCKKWKLSAIVLSTALLFCSCAVQSNDGEERETTVNKTEEKVDKEKIRLDALNPTAYGNVEGLNLEPGTYFSLLGKAASGDYWDNVQEGAQQAVDDINEALGYKGDDKVRMVYSGPGENGNVDEQVNILDEELARYPAAVAISIIDSQSCDVQFDLAAENGIPVVTFDSGSNYQNIMARISTNNTAAAEEAAVHMAAALENKGEVMVFVHDSRSITAKEREEAFVNKIKNDYPEMEVKNIYYLEDLDSLKQTMADEINGGTYAKAGEEARVNEDPETQVQAADITDDELMDYIFAKNPDVKGIYGTSGNAVMTAAEQSARLEKDVKIVGFDATEEEVQALQDGSIYGLVAQNPYGMGYAAIVASARSILDMGNEAEIDSGYIWVDADNMEEGEIAAMLY